MQTASLPHRIKTFYERVNVKRDAALGDLTELYADDVRFVNPVTVGQGMAPFRKAWETALRQYKVFTFNHVEVAGSDELFSLNYSMTISFGFGPSFTIDMTTVCRGRDGKVVYLRDYFDPLGSLVRPFAPMRWLYEIVFRRLIA